jgi:hypothetical protein
MVATSSPYTRLIPAVAAVVLIFILYMTPTFHLPSSEITTPAPDVDTLSLSTLSGEHDLSEIGHDLEEQPALITSTPVETSPVIISDEVVPVIDDTSVTMSTPGLSYDIVVSYYNEDIASTTERLVQILELPVLRDYVRIRLFVYVKNEKEWVDEIEAALLAANIVNDQLLEPIVIHMPNQGREGGTFLTHIYERWDDLASHTMFIQAEMHHFGDAINRLSDYLIPATGILNLGMHFTCSCLRCTEPWDENRAFPRIIEMYTMVNGEFCDDAVPISYLGQLVVSQARIRANEREFYKYVLDTLVSDMENPIHKDPRQDMFNDSPSNPYFGHTIERAYLVLFGATGTSVAHSCGFGIAGLGHRKPADEPYSKCQWLDE